MLKTLKDEAERMAANSGEFIYPYRLSECVKAASRALDAILKANVTFSYSEIHFILKVIIHACESASGIPYADAPDGDNER